MSSVFTTLENIIASILQNCTVIPIYKLGCNLAVTITTQETKKEKQNLKKAPTGYLSRQNSFAISTDVSFCGNQVKELYIPHVTSDPIYSQSPLYLP